MGEQLYVIATMETSLTQPLVTKSEFIRRLDGAFREAFCTLTEKMDWDKVIEIVLHGTEKEQPSTEDIRRMRGTIVSDGKREPRE